MFRIGEFSKLTPAEVDKWTGHRLYWVDQIPLEHHTPIEFEMPR